MNPKVKESLHCTLFWLTLDRTLLKLDLILDSVLYECNFFPNSKNLKILPIRRCTQNVGGETKRNFSYRQTALRGGVLVFQIFCQSVVTLFFSSLDNYLL
jgi:hypothetical protein